MEDEGKIKPCHQVPLPSALVVPPSSLIPKSGGFAREGCLNPYGHYGGLKPDKLLGFERPGPRAYRSLKRGRRLPRKCVDSGMSPS